MERARRICFDRLLPRELLRQARINEVARLGGRPRAVSPIGKNWVNGSTLRVRFMGGTATQKAIVREQANWWTEHANLRFEFNDAADAEIRISFDPQDGAWSYVGIDCRGVPIDEATMNLGFIDGGTAAHEFGHAIGLGHEHQNPLAGFMWNEEAIFADLAGPPNHWDKATTRQHLIAKYAADLINGIQFDSDSIMLYFFPEDWTLDGVGIRANAMLSALDKAFIAGTRMYPKAR